MLGPLIVQKDDYPVQGDLNKVISYEAQREIFLSRKESRPMSTELDMGGFSIDNIKDPTNLDQAVNKKTLDTALNSKADTSDLEKYFKKDEISQLNNKYLDLQGIRKMKGNIQMDGHQVSGLINIPNADDHATNKKYVDDIVRKVNIQPSSTPKNVFKYILDDVNEWSSEYNIKVLSFSDLPESPHTWNKKVLNIFPIKYSNDYRFRLGLQVFPVVINQTYSLCIELFNRDYITWSRQQTFIEGIGVWLKSHNTIKYQHHYGSNGDLYYSRNIIKFNKTSIGGPSQIYFTIHFDNRGGDPNTYPNEFKNQLYVVSYGCKGDFNNIDSSVYDFHKAYDIDKNKMKTLIPLDMNNKSINNIGNLSYGGLISIFGNIHRIININYFTILDNFQIKLLLKKVHIQWIRIYTSRIFKETSDVLVIQKGENQEERFSFNHPPHGYAQININRYYQTIDNIKLIRAYNLSYHLTYSLFY